jgi:hypothetical protein
LFNVQVAAAAVSCECTGGSSSCFLFNVQVAAAAVSCECTGGSSLADILFLLPLLLQLLLPLLSPPTTPPVLPTPPPPASPPPFRPPPFRPPPPLFLSVYKPVFPIFGKKIINLKIGLSKYFTLKFAIVIFKKLAVYSTLQYSIL